MLSKKLTTVIVSISTVAIALAPAMAFADTEAGIIGNGAFSQSQITATTTKTNTAVQNNKADISNVITSNSNTGENNTNFNTGGNSVIETGSATNNTQIVNEANSNKLLVPAGCDCANGGAQLLVKDNGAFSTSGIAASSETNNSLFQSNDANVRNRVTSDSNSGGNNSNDGTNGNNTIVTGPAKDNVGVWNAVNQNIASAGNVNGDSGVFGTTAEVIGNGAFAQNNITVAKTNTNIADQTNSADISNNVKSNANSGENNGDFTTGGSTLISTGPAVNNTLVKNLANSNMVAGFSGCGCEDVTLLKAGVNGANSVNNISDSSSTSNSLFQTNDSQVRNSVDANQESGENSASFSTGNVFGFADPTVLAGPAGSNTAVSTAVNSNAAGSGDISMGGWDLNFTWGLPLPW